MLESAPEDIITPRYDIIDIAVLVLISVVTDGTPDYDTIHFRLRRMGPVNKCFPGQPIVLSLIYGPRYGIGRWRYPRTVLPVPVHMGRMHWSKQG